MVQAVSLAAVVVVGWGMRRIGWVRGEDFPIFSRLVLNVTLPAALIVSFDRITMTGQLLLLALAGFLISGVLLLAGRAIAARSADPVARGFSVMNTGSFNVGAFAIPYLAGIAGPHAVVIASMFDVGNVVNTAGTSRAWATALVAPERAQGAGAFVRQMFSSVIFDVYLALVLLRALDLHVPQPALPFLEIVAAANPFLAMLMIGVGLRVVLPRSQYRTAALHLGVRWGLCALMAAGIWFLAPLDPELRAVLCALCFAPLASMVPGFTWQLGGDVELSSFIASASMVVAIVAIPAVLILLG